jgi:hypothetical protein
MPSIFIDGVDFATLELEFLHWLIASEGVNVLALNSYCWEE